MQINTCFKEHYRKQTTIIHKGNERLKNIISTFGTIPKSQYEDHHYFIASGLRNLVSRALPATHNDENSIDHCYQLMTEKYGDNCIRKTNPL